MIIDNNENRNSVLRRHCNLVSQMQIMFDAIGISRGIEGRRITHDELDAMRQRIFAHAEQHQITPVEIDAYRNRGRVRSSSVLDAVEKLSEN